MAFWLVDLLKSSEPDRHGVQVIEREVCHVIEQFTRYSHSRYLLRALWPKERVYQVHADNNRSAVFRRYRLC